jgi:hypothetical protein
MRVDLPPSEVAWFRDVLGTEQYLREERNYKVALHRAGTVRDCVVSKLGF